MRISLFTDLKSVLRLEPGNKQAMAELAKLEVSSFSIMSLLYTTSPVTWQWHRAKHVMYTLVAG